jgi:hypothetical protein
MPLSNSSLVLCLAAKKDLPSWENQSVPTSLENRALFVVHVARVLDMTRFSQLLRVSHKTFSREANYRLDIN